MPMPISARGCDTTMQYPSDGRESEARLQEAREALTQLLANRSEMAVVERAASFLLRKRAGAFDVREAIADAVNDTYCGEAPWPAGVTMTVHLVRTLRRHVAHARRATSPMVPIEQLPSAQEPVVQESAADPAVDARLAQVERTVGALRDLAHTDAQLAHLLLVLESGRARTAAVQAGMTRREYDNARRRLARLARAIAREGSDNDMKVAYLLPRTGSASAVKRTRRARVSASQTESTAKRRVS